MIRIVLFVLPLAIFVLWLYLMRKHRDENGEFDAEAVMYLRTVAAASVLSLLGAVGYVFFAEDKNTLEPYHPVTTEDLQGDS